MCEILQSLRWSVNEQFSVAENEIFGVLDQAQKTCEVDMVKMFVKERLAAAAEEILVGFERAIREYQQEIDRQRTLLEIILKHTGASFHDPQQLFFGKGEVSPSLDPEPEEEPPEPAHTGQEPEKPWTSQEEERLPGLEEADIIRFTFNPGPEKGGEGGVGPAETSGEAEPLAGTSTGQMRASTAPGAGGGCVAGWRRREQEEDCGVPEATGYRDDSETDTADSDDEWQEEDDWQEGRAPWSGFGGVPPSSVETRASKTRYVDRPVALHAAPVPLSCTMCDKTFTRKSNLKRHLALHTGERAFICTVCEKAFSLKIHLNVHMRTHTGERPFKCTVCGKEFSDESNMKIHMRIHTGERPFRCEICEKGFSQKISLETHMRTHTGIRPFKCSVCGKGFSDESNMKIHMRIHTGERPFKCVICEKRFLQKIGLEVHMKTHAAKQRQDNDTCVRKTQPEHTQVSIKDDGV